MERLRSLCERVEAAAALADQFLPTAGPLDLLLARRDFYSRAMWTREAADYVATNAIDLESLNCHAGLIAITNCEFCGNGAFYFADEADEDGKSAAVIEVYGEDDETVVDLCSWPSDNPDSFATIYGAEALGLARASNAATWSFGGALNLYRTPLRGRSTRTAFGSFAGSIGKGQWMALSAISAASPFDDR
jgi:hypothetical protein